MLVLTIVVGLVLLYGVLNHLRHHILIFPEGSWRPKISRDKTLFLISFWRFLYFSDEKEMNRRLKKIIEEYDGRNNTETDKV